MEIKQIRGLRKDNNVASYVVFGDETLRVEHNLGADVPDFTLMSTSEAAEDMTRRMGTGWTSFTIVSLPSDEDLGEAPTGPLPNPLDDTQPMDDIEDLSDTQPMDDPS